MSRSTSLSNYTGVATTREIDSRYDVIKEVSEHLDTLETVATEDLDALTIALNEAKDFTGITVVSGTPANWDANTKTLTVPTLQGIQGEQGIAGQDGSQGIQGEQGPQGEQGLRGVDGPQGPLGLTGSRGEQGISVHHLKGTNTSDPEGDFTTYGEVDTFTLYGDAAETLNLGYFSIQNGMSIYQAALAGGFAGTESDLYNQLGSFSTYYYDSSVNAQEAALSAGEAAADRAAVELVFDNFDDRYLGAKTSDPIVDNDGDPLVIGQVYWHIEDTELKFYNGTMWEAPSEQATTSAANALISAGSASDSADAAELAQAAAELAEGASSTSALAASAAASAALESEENAAASELAASVSEENASTSETNAASSASSASTSEINAADYASSAATSDTSAATSASSATASATSASASETNSASSASAASISAVNAATSETNAGTSEANAAQHLADVVLIYDQFDDRYLGAKAADPLLDNDGNALAVGTLYYNTVDNEVRFYDGMVWDRPEYSASQSALIAQGHADAASTSATNASTSETNASSSEGASALSASNASTSEANASASASSASISEAAAATSAGSASTSATNASTSEAKAQDWAEELEDVEVEIGKYSALHHKEKALDAQTAAELAATNASTSETNAGNSEQSATLSEGNAATSATNASTSETNAGTSAIAAAESALNAHNSEQAASVSEENAALSEQASALSEENAASSEENAEAYRTEVNLTTNLFYTVYLGASAVEPTTDLQGNPLVEGALFFDTTSNITKVYKGSAWFAAYVNLDGALLKDGNLSDLTDIAAAVATLNLTPGVDVQSYDSSTVVDSLYNNYSTDEKAKLAAIEVGTANLVKYPPVKNTTGSDIPKGTPVMAVGTDGNYTLITPAIADGVISPLYYIGVTVEEILDGELGQTTHFGIIDNVDTSSYLYGTILYVSPTTPGAVTTTKPISPDVIIYCAVVTHVDSENGRLFVRHETINNAEDVSYNNTVSELIASNVQSAVDELALAKADRNELSSNITLYPTTATGDFGYSRMVTDIEDADYGTIAVDVPTGPVNVDDQFIAGLIADAGLFVGNPGILSIPTIGNIAKTAGNSEQYAGFYFKVFKRDLAGVEDLIATSTSTGEVNPANGSYFQFSASAILNSGTWVDTDRIVIKYYAELLGNVSSEYQFQFGGDSPVRTEFPVPASILVITEAAGIVVDTSSFTGNLDGSAGTVQAALDILDSVEPLPQQSIGEQYLKTNGAVASWESVQANEVTVTPQGNLSSTTVQLSLEELQTEMDEIGTYTDYLAAFIAAEAD